MNVSVDLERLEQQCLITDSVETYARRELTPAHLRQPDFSRERWENMATLGLFATLLPEEAEGLGLKLGDIVPSLEVMGKRLMREPFVASSIMPSFVFGSALESELGAKLARRLGEGTLVPALAWQEGSVALASGDCKTIATQVAKGFELNGRKDFILPGRGYDGLIVSAILNEKLALFWLDGEQAGLSADVRPTADGGEVASITLVNVTLSADRLLLADGGDVLAKAVNAGAICASAEMLGLVRGAIEMTNDYLRTRKQFGRTIGSFQALQHRAADLYIQQELSAAALHRAVEEFEQASDTTDQIKAASRAKFRCSQTALRVTKEAVQMHGGIGYTDEHDIGLYLKRALTLSAWLGNAAEHRRRFANISFGGPQ